MLLAYRREAMRYEPRLRLRVKGGLGSSALSISMQNLENDKSKCSKELSDRVVVDSLIAMTTVRISGDNQFGIVVLNLQ